MILKIIMKILNLNLRNQPKIYGMNMLKRQQQN